jgi:hypothetical protein
MTGTRGQTVLLWGIAITVLVEAITVYLRFHKGINATLPGDVERF